MFFETENINWNWGKSKDINLDINQITKHSKRLTFVTVGLLAPTGAIIVIMMFYDVL